MSEKSETLTRVMIATISAGAIAAICTCYVPSTHDDPIASERMSHASSLATTIGSRAVFEAMGTRKDGQSIVNSLNLSDIRIDHDEPTLRIVDDSPVDHLVLTVKINWIVNDSGNDFAISDPCTVRPSGDHVAPPTAFIPVMALDTAYGDEIRDPDSFYRGNQWAKDRQGEYIRMNNGQRVLLSSLPVTLATATCRFGSDGTGYTKTATNFAVRTIQEKDRTPFPAPQNVLEFAIPVAPDYVSEDTTLAASAYPYIFGGLYIADADYEAVAYAPLS